MIQLLTVRIPYQIFLTRYVNVIVDGGPPEKNDRYIYRLDQNREWNIQNLPWSGDMDVYKDGQRLKIIAII